MQSKRGFQSGKIELSQFWELGLFSSLQNLKKLSSRLEKEKKENKVERLPQEEKKGRLGFKLGKAHNTFRNNNLRTGLTNWLIIIKIITLLSTKQSQNLEAMVMLVQIALFVVNRYLHQHYFVFRLDTKKLNISVLLQKLERLSS